jgi:hypothetical protein
MADRICDKICDKIETVCSGRIDEKSLALILVYSMQVAENTRGLSGMEKKEVCLHSIKLTIDKHVKDQYIKEKLVNTVDTILPSMIDAIVSSAMSRGPWSFKKNRKLFKRCC